MINPLFLLSLFLSFHLFVHGERHTETDKETPKKHYNLTDEDIDVVIVAHPKDIETLDLCIKGIKENCKRVRRVIVVSEKKLTDEAEWFDEKLYPFSLDDVMMAIAKGDRKKGEKYFRHSNRGCGWFLQQLLKLGAPFVIPHISSNVLVIDADTIFMNPVDFLNKRKGGLFAFSRIEPKERYLRHADRLLPDYKRVHTEVYSVCHHMLFQRAILEDLFDVVEKHHQVPFWVAFCSCVDLNEDKVAASEYEIYFSFAFNHTDQVGLRELKWTNSAYLNKMDLFKRNRYDYVSFHSYARERAKKKPPVMLTR
ncbi:MAG: DUF6492 family protein [Parachlamydiaceae bacterium]